MVGSSLSECLEDTTGDCKIFYQYELSNVIAAGCLAHDIGNPAFGHSGEKAISAYFLNNAAFVIDGQALQSFFTAAQWADISNFEGNANAIRILTHTFKGRLSAGLGLTYTTIASILKYPCSSSAINPSLKHRKKYGFFQSESQVVHTIATHLGMLPEEGATGFKRHPFVYLVEAADDICYRVIDLEDAHRLGLLDFPLVKDSFLSVIEAVSDSNRLDRIHATCNRIADKNETISYLRAKAINILTHATADVFLQSKAQILAGTFNDTLVDNIEGRTNAFKEVMKLSAEKIYNHDTVLEIEIAGYNVMSELLALFVPALLRLEPDHKDQKIRRLFPLQFRSFEDTDNPYDKVLCALDLISGMTDEYATALYRKLKGIEIPQHK